MTTGMEIIEVEPVRSAVFGTDNPSAIVQRVADVATPLGRFIKERGMATQISGREYVLSEGWAFMGSMLGVFPRPVALTELKEEGGRVYGYEAHVELVTSTGAVVGGGIAECSRYEKNWSDRDDFALKSMAQTRATGKAYRLSFGYVMKAAGYEATPAEEMGVEHHEPRRAQVHLPAQPIPAPDWWALLQAEIVEAKLTRDEVSAALGCQPAGIKHGAQEWLNEHGTGEVETDVKALVVYLVGDRPF